MPLDKETTIFNNISMANKKDITTTYLDPQIKTKGKVFAVRKGWSFSKLLELAIPFFIENHDKIKTA